MRFAQKQEAEDTIEGHYDPDQQLFVNPGGTPVFGGLSWKTYYYYWTVNIDRRDEGWRWDTYGW